jgi:uncharacterized repeat protein (TIGR02543 family)
MAILCRRPAATKKKKGFFRIAELEYFFATSCHDGGFQRHVLCMKTKLVMLRRSSLERFRQAITLSDSGPLIAVAAFLLGPQLAFCSPVILFNNFGAGNSFGPVTNAYCIGGNNVGCAGIPYEPAFAFTPATTAYLTEINLAIYNAAQGGVEGSAVISLMTDSSGLPGPSLLEQWTVTPSGDEVYTLNSMLHPLLTAGTRYWLVAANTLGRSGVVGWNRSVASQSGPYADMKTGSWVLESSNATQGAFEIQADTSNPTVQLTTTASPSGSGTITANPPSQTGIYASGSIVCLTALPTPGYIFTGWTGTALNAAGCLMIPSPGSAAVSVTANFTVESSLPPLRFVPATPCRLVDTRGAAGPLGGPSIAAGMARSFTIPGTCSIPSTAAAYSLNLTVVPEGALGYVTLWPTGQTQPLTSTLNSLDGRIKSNAAIVPAGTGGAVSVFATDSTDVILDINGYFDAASDATALAFYPLTPCRVADTRNGTGALGGPSLLGGQSRVLPVENSSCNIPANALAYSLNFTAVPQGPLGYLTVWPAGQSQPVVSTLNAPTAAVTANAAIVPAGNAGAIELFVTDNTDMVIDINGYLAAAGTGGYSFYNLAPCRIEDSRQPAGNPAFTGTLTVTATGVPCGVPPEAQALVLNATVVPSGVLEYLTLWANGSSQPVVSTLNSLDGSLTSNMALVPTTNGSVNAYAAGPAPTYLILDISGYFAP